MPGQHRRPGPGHRPCDPALLGRPSPPSCRRTTPLLWSASSILWATSSRIRRQVPVERRCRFLARLQGNPSRRHHHPARELLVCHLPNHGTVGLRLDGRGPGGRTAKARRAGDLCSQRRGTPGSGDGVVRQPAAQMRDLLYGVGRSPCPLFALSTPSHASPTARTATTILTSASGARTKESSRNTCGTLMQTPHGQPPKALGPPTCGAARAPSLPGRAISSWQWTRKTIA